VPILVVDIYREAGLHYCVLDEPLRPEAYQDQPDPVKALTQAYTARMEAHIRRHPDQWFWVHDRWKSAERAARDHPDLLNSRYSTGAIAERTSVPPTASP